MYYLQPLQIERMPEAVKKASEAAQEANVSFAAKPLNPSEVPPSLAKAQSLVRAWVKPEFPRSLSAKINNVSILKND